MCTNIMKNLYRYIILILLFITTTSFDYQPQIREPFEEYNKIEEPYKEPNKAPINWNDLDYDNPVWGWYYKQLWYLYHPNSTETPPWLKTVPINDEYIFLICLLTYILLKTQTYKKKERITNK